MCGANLKASAGDCKLSGGRKTAPPAALARDQFAPQFSAIFPIMKACGPALLFALLLAHAGAAMAQETPSTGGALVGRFLDATGLRAPPPPAADFVRESRPERLDYEPLSPTPTPTKKRKAADMRALGASLDAAIAANRAKAARVRFPDSGPPAARKRSQ